MNLPNFFPALNFFFSFVPIAILLESMRQKEMLLKSEPQLLHPGQCSPFGTHRIDDRSLGCAVVNPARAPTSRSPNIPRFWNSRVHYGRGRQASSHGDPHYHHGVMKESSPDVSILLCMSNTGSTAVQPNIDMASAPDRPKKNLKHKTKGDEGPPWLHYQVMSGHTDTHLHMQLAPPSPSRELGRRVSERTSHMQPPTRRVLGPFAVPCPVQLSQSHPCQMFRTLIVSAPLHAI